MKYFKLLLWLLLPFTINARYKPTWESLDSRPDAHGTFQMPGLKKPLAFKKVKDGIEVTVPGLSAKEVPCEYARTFKMTDII